MLYLKIFFNISYKSIKTRIKSIKINQMKNNILILLIFSFFYSCSSYQFQQPEYVKKQNEKEIKLNKVGNFRDIGGLVNVQNRTLKSNFFYRSANLHQLKNSSFDELEALKISKIIDLRTANEIDHKPDNLPQNITYLNLAAFDDKEDQMTQARKLVLKGKVDQTDAEKRMLDFYREYVTEKPEVIREIIHQILDSDEAVLYHCTAGKDRTGIITALILKILKFDDSTIYHDFLFTNNQREKEVKKRLKMAKTFHFLFPKMDIGVLEKLSWVEREYLETTFKEIDAKYGSMDNYIHDVLKISEEDRQNYIDRFTYQ